MYYFIDDIMINIHMEVINMKFRIEKDSLGELKVPEDSLWGAQTQRSIENFKIGSRVMPYQMIRSLVLVKKAAAMANKNLGVIDSDIADSIVRSCDIILDGDYREQFPLLVWQTGSGTQTNMNVNEVISHIANEILITKNIHPNDHVNKSQSTNDVFPTAMHISAAMAVEKELFVSVDKFINQLKILEVENKDVIKTGRTHLQDATPITLAQEISGWRKMLEINKEMLKDSIKYLNILAIGGTAVGTGLNAHPKFANKVVEEINKMLGSSFIESQNKFYSLTSKDAFVFSHGALNALAANLMKIANDIRRLASGPRCGIGELEIPANEPGSSIMPGKINPTQAEALTMIVTKVMGNNTAISMAASQGNFELNVYMPSIIADFLESVELLSKGMDSFNDKCLCGLKANKKKINSFLNDSLMLVTALTPHIGYDNAASIAKRALNEEKTLKDVALEMGLLTEEEFDTYMDIANMTHPNLK